MLRKTIVGIAAAAVIGAVALAPTVASARGGGGHGGGHGGFHGGGHGFGSSGFRSFGPARSFGHFRAARFRALGGPYVSYGGCYRWVGTPYGLQLVNVCNYYYY